MTEESIYFQDHMPNNICFGCGSLNAQGLQIKSYWEGDEGVCMWIPEPQYRGWEGIINGGIIATLMDCHCMCTALAAAYRAEDRPMASDPVYRYATVRICVNYHKPTPDNRPIQLRAQVVELQGRKATLTCQVMVDDQITADGEVIGVRVVEGAPKPESTFR